MAFSCALIVFVLLISNNLNKKGLGKNHKSIFIWTIFFCIQDAIWGLFASHIIRNDILLFITSNIFHLASILSAVGWTSYFLSRIKQANKKYTSLFIVSGLVALAQIVLIVINIFTKFMFYVDDKGWYQSTIYRSILFYAQFATYIVIGIVSFVQNFKHQSKDRKVELLAIFFVNLAPLFFGVVQLIYPDAPANSIGFSLACVIVELFLTKHFEEQVVTLEQNQIALANYKKAILSGALIAFEVNLSKNELYYGICKDENGKEHNLGDIFKISIPCNYDDYIEMWCEKYVNKENSKKYLINSKSKYLLDSFNKGITETTYDYQAKNLSGKNVWLRRIVCMLRNVNNEIIAYSCVKDITKYVEESKKEESYIRALATEYDLIEVISIKKDKTEDQVLIHSQVSLELMKLLGENVIEEKGFSLQLEEFCHCIHPEDQKHFYTLTRREKIFESFNKKQKHYVNFRLASGKDEYLYYQIRFIPMTDEGGERHSIIVCVRNIDAEIRKEIEIRKQLEEAKIAAETANNSKSVFLFTMSHDIRTPMNAIIGFTDIAQKHIDDKDKVIDALGKVRMSSNHLLTLINDVLDMSRIESGTVKVKEEAIDIREVQDNIYSILNGSAEAKNISLICNVDKSLLHTCQYTDRLCLMRVLSNVISNSIKYTNEGGSINMNIEELPCEKDDYAHIRFTIQDNGIGMSEEFLKHVFEPFTRAETVTKSGVVGTGLGMSITKSLVELLGGTITIKSKLYEGTTVIIDLINRIADPISLKHDEFDDACVSLEGKKVLLVEDNDLNREIAIEILEDSGMIVDIATDGDAAVEKVASSNEGQYDVILMDIQMPKMNGYDASRAIRKLPNEKLAKLPIIAMTANAFDEDKQNAINAGMNGHISKPISISLLIKALSNILK